MKTSAQQKVKNRGRGIADYPKPWHRTLRHHLNIISLGQLAIRVIHRQQEHPHPALVIVLMALNLFLALLIAAVLVAIYATINYN